MTMGAYRIEGEMTDECRNGSFPTSSNFGSTSSRFPAMFISTMVKAGNDKVPFDVEKTGLGWRTDMRVETETTMRPTVCKMKRPKK